MSMRDGAFIFRCELCGKEFKTINLKSFSQTMRRHREKVHPDHKGSIHFKNTEKI